MRLPPGVRRDRWAGAADAEAELQFHLETKIEALMALGVSREEARARALAAFGPVGSVAAACAAIDRRHHARRRRMIRLRGTLLEFRSATRGLLRTPGYALVATATFALGIGATTAVFGVLDGVLFKPVPYAHRERLIRIWEEDRREGRRGQITIADLGDWSREATRFDGFAGFRWRSATLAGADGDPVQLTAADVTAPFFEILGVRPALGRTFAAGEDAVSPAAVAVLDHRLWVERFGADSGIVGRTVPIGGIVRTVIGILPRDFHNPFGDRVAVWLPNDFAAIANDPGRSRRMHFLAGVGRLRSGVSFEEGRAELLALGDRLAGRHPETNRDHYPFAVPLQDAGVLGVRAPLYLVLAAVGCLLLLACANLANLVFARALTRSREFALRAALGAGSWRIARGILAEQLVLAAVGIGAGLGLASLVVTAARRGLVDLIPRIDRVAIDGRAVAVAAVVTLTAALVSGLVPGLLAIRRGAAVDGGLVGRAGLTRRAARGRDLLVAVQAALAALLLVAAGLTARSMARLLGEELGFRPERVWTFQVALPVARYPDAPARDGLRVALLERIRTLPGVISASASYALPMTNVSTTGIVVEGAPPAEGPAPAVGYNAADDDYFRTLGIPLLEGRDFGPNDRDGAPSVAIVNRSLAARFFPGRSALGGRFRSGPDSSAPAVEIVGVVGDIRREGRGVAPAPEVYFPLGQDGTPQPTFSVRLAGDPGAVLAGVRAALRQLDPQIPLGSSRGLDDVVAGTVQTPRVVAVVLRGFAAMALVLAAVGIFGVVSFLVAERRRELAVRLAIGATGGAILRETVRRGLAPVLAGLGVGLLAALLAGSALRGLLYRVTPADPVVLAVVAVLVAAVGAAGALLPAVRAARVPPAAVLRD